MESGLQDSTMEDYRCLSLSLFFFNRCLYNLKPEDLYFLFFSISLLLLTWRCD